MSLRIIPLGGTTNVNKNMFVYELENDIIIVDCGIGFPDSSDYGVDLVIPNFKYILENQHKVRALLVTHGHEDHFGAVPFLLNEIKVPVYAPRLVCGFIRNKLEDYGMNKGVDLRPLKESSVLNIGQFVVTSFSVNHSVPDTFGFSIQTPEGKIIHVSDFKFDWTPVMDKPFNIAKLSRLSEKGVDVLMSDSLGATTPGYTKSEKYIEDTFNEVLSKANGQVLITTMSSNISRIQQAISASLKHDRKVVISGRSVEQNISAAIGLGYLNFPKEIFVPQEKAMRVPQDKLTYIIAGSYGQDNSALYRVSTETHKHIKLEKGATVVFSADPNPPGVLEAVNFVIDRLTLLGAEVLYSEIQENLHVSGHGSMGDISMLAALVRPKYFIPIGGTVKYMRAYKNLMIDMGFNGSSVYELLDGESVELRGGKLTRGKKVNVGNIYVDGAGIGDVGSIVLKDRKELADSGMVVVAIPYRLDKKQFGKDIEVVSRGFVYVKESKKLMADIERIVKQNLQRLKQKERDFSAVKNKVEKEVSKFLYKETARDPIVMVVIVEV